MSGVPVEDVPMPMAPFVCGDSADSVLKTPSWLGPVVVASRGARESDDRAIGIVSPLPQRA
jgi:hypothetical protein